MPRKPEYIIDKVLEKAIPLILELGYAGCSMQLLLKTTNFNRRAFYLKFHNKKIFTERLLKYYIDTKLMPLQQALLLPTDYKTAVSQFFDNYQTLINKQGCLLVKLVLELGKTNKNVQSQARRYYDTLELNFIACLEKAKLSGDIETDVDIENFALKLTCLSQGFAVSNNITEGHAEVMLLIKSLLPETNNPIKSFF